MVTSYGFVANTTATSLVNVAGRKNVQVQNLGPAPVFIGGLGVSPTSGILIPPGATESLDVGAATLQVVTLLGTSDVRVLQIS